MLSRQVAALVAGEVSLFSGLAVAWLPLVPIVAGVQLVAWALFARMGDA